MSGIEVVQWLSWADQDYLAARSLLSRDYILQGTILANTAIEKYIKAVLTYRQKAFPKGWKGHDVMALYQSFQSSGRAPAVNEGFLRDLGKAYKLRYPDDLNDGFNISLAGIKVLTELDSTVYAIRNGFVINRAGKSAGTKLDHLIATQGPELVERNVAFGTTARSQVVNTPTACFELRVLNGGEIMSLEYTAGPIPDDRLFDRPGLVPTHPAQGPAHLTHPV